MTTSGTINSSMVVADIITQAMREIGAISAGERPTAQETTDAITVLNWMLKGWQARGIVSWRDVDGSVTFPAGTAQMTLTPRCLDVTSARAVQSASFERPLQRWVLGQYRQTPNKSQPGTPTAYTIIKTNDEIAMKIWPVPTVDMVINYSYSRVIEDVTSAAQTIDVPQHWTEALFLGLAARMVHSYGMTRMDPTAAQLVLQRAASLEQMLLDDDRPPSMFMGSAYGRNF